MPAGHAGGTMGAMRFACLMLLFALPAWAAPPLQALLDATPAGAKP